MRINRINPIIYIWIVASLALIIWVFAKAPPKQERLLYSDQAVHAMIGSSIWNDGDLKYSLNDLKRFREDFPKESGPRGVFLKQGFSGDLYYAKPYLYGLAAAPLYGLAGTDGFIYLNIICFLIIGTIIGLVLTRPFGIGWATFASLVFMVPSAFMPWLFVIHPDLFIAALISLGGYLILKDGMVRSGMILGAVILGASLNEKITFIIIIPFMIMAMTNANWNRRIFISMIVIFSWLMFTSVNIAVDGSLLSYQGLRFGVENTPFPLEIGWIMPTHSITGHIFNPTGLLLTLIDNINILPEKIIDFLIGRQAGFIPYFTFAFGVLLIRPFFIWTRSGLILIPFFLYFILHWLAFPLNGYGGSGTYGSRYMLQALPLIPLSYLGADLKHCYQSSSIFKIGIKVFLCGATLLGLIIQYQIFTNGHELVKNYTNALTSEPLNIFPIENWLIPRSLGHKTSKEYRNEDGKWNFRIYKLDEANTNTWFRTESQYKKTSIVLYKRYSEDTFPPIYIRSPFDAKVRILNDGKMIWNEDLIAAEPKILDVNSLAYFHSAFSLSSNSKVAWTELIIETDMLREQDSKNQYAPYSIDFATELRPLVFDAFDRYITAADFIVMGGDLSQGWSYIEPWGVWSDNEIAYIYTKVGNDTKFNVLLNAHAFVAKPNQQLEIEISCYNTTPVKVHFKQDESKIIQLFCEKTNQQQYLVIKTKVKGPTSPWAEGLNEDTRLLGIGLKELKFERLN
jgi:hypothetical protein